MNYPVGWHFFDKFGYSGAN